jgi:hypothetical protein
MTMIVKVSGGIMRAALRFVDFLLKEDIAFAELQGGLITLMWALWVAAASAELRTNCSLEQEIFYNLPWLGSLVGVLFIGLSASQIFCVVQKTGQRYREAFAFTSFLWWSFLGGMQMYLAPSAITVPMYLSFSTGSAWAYFRAMSFRRTL